VRYSRIIVLWIYASVESSGSVAPADDTREQYSHNESKRDTQTNPKRLSVDIGKKERYEPVDKHKNRTSDPVPDVAQHNVENKRKDPNHKDQTQ
jgi:hypothetical protein